MGRPKVKNRERFDCGKLKPEFGSPNQVKRILDRAKIEANNSLLGSEVGRLRMNDVLTDRQTMALLRFAEEVGQFDRAKNNPRRTVASPSYERGMNQGGGVTGTADDQLVLTVLHELNAKEKDPKKIKENVDKFAEEHPRTRAILQITKRYEATLAQLRLGGPKVVNAVMTCAVYNDMLTFEGKKALVLGAELLAGHYLLTSGR